MDLVELDKKLHLAKQMLNTAMLEKWGKYENISFMISSTQKNPSTGKIVGFDAPYLRVRLVSLKRPLKNVHYQNVIDT